MSHRNGPYFTVGLVGRAGVGKDTSAAVLIESHGFARLAFADPLRIEIARSFGIDSRMLTTRHLKERATIALAIGRSDDARFIAHMVSVGIDPTRARSPRDIMTLWATEYRRQLDGSNYWILKAHEAVEQLHRDGRRRIAFTDVRFLDEADFVRSLGGALWRVRRREVERARAAHQSELEQAQIACDLEIQNDGSLDFLGCQVLTAYSQEAAFTG